MHQIDQITEFVRRSRGKRIILRSEALCELVTDTGRQPVNRFMSYKEVESLVKEILPQDRLISFVEKETLTFPYSSKQGEWTIGVRQPNGSMEVVIGAPNAFEFDELESPPVAPPPPPPPEEPTVEVEPAAPPPRQAPPPSPPPPSPMVPTAQVVHYPREYLPKLFRVALECRASDLHLRTGMQPRLRVHGMMRTVEYGRLTPEQLQAALTDLIPAAHQPSWAERGRALFGWSLEEELRLRCCVFRERDGVAASFRLMPFEPPPLDALRAPATLADLARVDQGLVLLSGPRGAGLSTTLAAVLATLNSERSVHIATIETPIEYLHRPNRALVTQIEVPTQAPTRADALQLIEVLDADVAAVDDVSDPGLLRSALALAESGRLVFGVLHQPDAPSVIEALVQSLEMADYAQAAERVIRGVRAVLCQRLCRPKRPTDPLVPVFEMLPMNAPAATLIRQGKSKDLHSTMMITFNKMLLRAVQEGRISPDEALARSSEPEGLRSQLAALLSRPG